MTIAEIAPPPAGPEVDPDALVCPGCAEPVRDVPPPEWPVRAGVAPDWSHRDGSVLCPDGRGRVPEPVETGGLRFDLTATGARVLDEAERVQP